MRCSCYTGRSRCPANATTAPMAPDDVKPYGVYCLEHGEEVLAEYREKLDPGWRLVQVDEWGRVKE